MYRVCQSLCPGKYNAANATDADDLDSNSGRTGMHTVVANALKLAPGAALSHITRDNQGHPSTKEDELKLVMAVETINSLLSQSQLMVGREVIRRVCTAIC